MYLCTHNSASLGLFLSALARVHSNFDIDIKMAPINDGVTYFTPHADTSLLIIETLFSTDKDEMSYKC